MRYRRIQRTALAGLFLAAVATALYAERPEGALAGRVTTATTPLAQARVYAYQMSDLSLHRVDTDTVGSFLFRQLPAGLYKIIAVKVGFVPAVVLLNRETRETSQYLEVDLAPQSADASPGQGDFWSLRQRIPKDVLRDLETLEMATVEEDPAAPTRRASLTETTIEAMAGSDDAVGTGGESSRNQVVLAGNVGTTEFDLTGDVWVTRGRRVAEEPSYATELSLGLNPTDGSRVRLTTVDNSMNPYAASHGPVNLERYQVSWSQAYQQGTSEVRAEFVDESNFYAAGPVQPIGVPLASRSWNVEGLYSGNLTRSDTLRAGFRFRQYEEDDISATSALLPAQRVDLFGTGATRVNPRILVEYGLYSTLRDGSLSLAPRGGVVVELGSDWQASTLVSHQVHEDTPDTLYDFMPVAFRGNGACQGEDSCYQLQLTRSRTDDSELSIGAMHRRFGETLRLYFNDDFFSHLESLYLVDGDQLPEVQFAMTSRLSPRVLARLESSIAAGGGGILYATDQNSYENSVRYLVTSLDTRFETTDTGVFLAFHHLEQELERLDARLGASGPALEMQRLQLMLTQDLKALNLASLALRLNMEVARGSSSSDLEDDEELRKRVMGGVAVTF